MIPHTYPTVISGGQTKMLVYVLSSVAGLQAWIDYIPVKQDTAGLQNHYDGHILSNALTDITGKQAWVDYVPVYIVAGATEKYSTNSSGYIPLSDVLSAPVGGFDIILAAGQSNMSGFIDFNAGLDAADPNVFQYCVFPSDPNYQTIQAAENPPSNPDKINTGKVSVAHSFAKRYYALTGRKVVLVPVSVGSTAVNTVVASVQPRWKPTTTQGDLYLSAISHCNNALVAANAIESGSRFVGTIWFQGESDAGFGANEASYIVALKNLIKGFRAGITGATNSFFIISGLVPEAVNTRQGYAEMQINQAQIASDIYGCAWSSTADLVGFSPDNLHFVSGGREAGTRMADKVSEALAAMSPKPPFPVTTLRAVTPTTTSIALTWTAPTRGSLVTDYVVEFKRDIDSIWTVFADGVTTTTGATVTGLTAGTLYNFRVSAIGDLGSASSYATISEATTSGATAIPNLVTGVTATVNSSSQITLSFTAPAGGNPFYDFRIEYKRTASGTWVVWEHDVSLATSYAITGLSSNTGYDFRVFTKGVGGTSAATTTVSATTTSVGSITYNFSGDTVGQPPAGMTDWSACLSKRVVRNTGAPATFSAGNYMTGTISDTNTSTTTLNNFTPAVNQRITWKRGSALATGRDGFTLRGQLQTPRGNSGNGTYSKILQGYNFEVNSVGNQLRIVRYLSNAIVIGTPFTFTVPTICWFRASVIGSALLFEYSTDNVTWNTAVSATEANIPEMGAVEYLSGMGNSQQNAVFITDIVYEQL